MSRTVDATMVDPSVLPYTARTRVSLAIARAVAAGRGERDVTPLHITLGLLREGENPAVAAFMHAGVNLGRLRGDVEMALGQPPGGNFRDDVALGVTPGEQRMVERARSISRQRRDEFLGPSHLLLAVLLDADSTASQILARHGIDASSAWVHLDAVMGTHQH